MRKKKGEDDHMEKKNHACRMQCMKGTWVYLLSTVVALQPLNQCVVGTAYFVGRRGSWLAMF